VGAPPCPLSVPASVHGGPSTPASPRRCGPGPWIYPLEINSLFGLFGYFAKRSLDFCESSKPAGEDQRFSSEGLHLVSISVQLLWFSIAREKLSFISLILCTGVLRLLLFGRRILSSWALRSH
jgi:hypothetical protein